MILADEVRQIRVDRARVNHETYKSIYDTVATRIRNRALRGDSSAVIQVPGMVPGRPVYDIMHASRYVRDKLRAGGFGVSGDIHAGVLTVDWQSHGQSRAKNPKKRTKKKAEPPKLPSERLAALKKILS